MECIKCYSMMANYGIRILGKSKKIKYQCGNCGYTKFEEYNKSDIKTNNIKRYIITSIQNDTEINKPFFDTLCNFAKLKSKQEKIQKFLDSFSDEIVKKTSFLPLVNGGASFKTHTLKTDSLFRKPNWWVRRSI